MGTALKELKKIGVTLGILSAVLFPLGLLMGVPWLIMLVSLLFGGLFTLANFLLLGSICEKACHKEPQKAKTYMQLHYAVRLILSAVVIIASFQLAYLHPLGVVAPMFAPKLTYFVIAIYQTLRKKPKNEAKHREKTTMD